MRKPFLFLFILISFQNFAQVAKKPVPNWIDERDHHGKGSSFRHYAYAVKVINSEGVSLYPIWVPYFNQ